MEFNFQSAHEFVVTAWANAVPYFQLVGEFLTNPWARAIGLGVIVYVTIRVIASVYSGDMQNSELGPIGLRPHVAQRSDRATVILPRVLMPMNMDGVTAQIRLFYVYTDARGKRAKRLIYTKPHARLGVMPVKLGKIASTIYGQEIPDVATADVCFPPVDLDQVPEGADATPPRALEYAALHNIVDNWTEDDEAPLISVHRDVHEEIAEARREFIVDGAARVAASREGNALQRWMKRGAALNRPNVVGSFYVKLEFSHDPWFVLTKHPDRELKMTAWLTVLTSMFALVMDAWPKALSAHETAARSPSGYEAPGRPLRIPR